MASLLPAFAADVAAESTGETGVEAAVGLVEELTPKVLPTHQSHFSAEPVVSPKRIESVRRP